MKVDPRSKVQKMGNLIVVDENNLDIFDVFDQAGIPDWKPAHKTEPYGDQYKVRLDIETTGSEPAIHKIIYIGLKLSKQGYSSYRFIHDVDEKIMLLEFLEYLNIPEVKEAAFLSTYNGFSFDWDFILYKIRLFGLQTLFPFHQDDFTTCFRTAQLWHNNPAVYQSVRFHDGRKTAIVDLFHQVLSWDFVNRKLGTGSGERSLKTVPVTLGLRTEPRIELTYQELLKAYQTPEGMELVKKYLKDDLDDTDLIGNMLEPAIWYDQDFHPDWKLQSLSTAGNGTKWNDLLIKAYNCQKVTETVILEDDFLVEEGEEPEFIEVERNVLKWLDYAAQEWVEVKPDQKFKYKGALTLAKAGVHRNTVKYDFASLYPHVQLNYGIHTRKDPKRYQLGVLVYGLDTRLELKELKEKGLLTLDDRQREGTLKVKINSSYGFTGAAHLPFNDMEAASLITGYARALFNHVLNCIQEYNNNVASVYPITCDTDGFAVSIEVGHEEKLRDYILSKLPKGVNSSGKQPKHLDLKLEWQAPLVFIPPDSAQKEVVELVEGVQNAPDGLKKNYIIIQNDGSVKVTGRFKKRDQSRLVREFQAEILKLYYKGGYGVAYKYYRELLKTCEDGKLDLDYIRITRKAKGNEKTIFDLGLVNENGYTSYYEGVAPMPNVRKTKGGFIYKTDQTKIDKINTGKITVKTNNAPYSRQYYYNLIKELWTEINMFIDPLLEHTNE